MRPNNKKHSLITEKLFPTTFSLLSSRFLILTFFSLLLAASSLLLNSCNTTEPPPIKNGPDTTSQNFIFETYEFGDGFSSSYFNDVWIFDENNIWAVGELRLDNGYTNIVRWDGKKWFSQKPYFTSSGFEGIWALDSSHIYFASGAIRKYIDGKFSVVNTNLGLKNGQGIFKLWGSSESNIWGVGPWGTIVHFDGKEWKKIDFDRQWNFYNITGSKETETAYAVGRNSDFNNIIVELKTGIATIIFNTAITAFPFNFTVLNMINNNELIFAGTDIGKFDLKSKKAEVIHDLPLGYGISLTAVYSPNDIYFFGDQYQQGEKMVHYNGVRFKTFDLSPSNSTIFGGAYAIKNLSVMVGFADNKAYLVTIKRE